LPVASEGIQFGREAVESHGVAGSSRVGAGNSFWRTGTIVVTVQRLTRSDAVVSTVACVLRTRGVTRSL
ncbi:hypothetical protein COCCADRAFT_96786, partial [Bipolaris zeicola 26-R-13]